jgi:hypothetical protein
MRKCECSSLQRVTRRIPDLKADEAVHCGLCGYPVRDSAREQQYGRIAQVIRRILVRLGGLRSRHYIVRLTGTGPHQGAGT